MTKMEEKQKSVLTVLCATMLGGAEGWQLNTI
jgi:hypothetical protein